MARLLNTDEGVWVILIRVVEGYVIKVSPFKDKDAMVTVLTPEGLFSFYARRVFDIKSQDAAGTTLGSYSQCHLRQGKSKGWTLTHVKNIRVPMQSLHGVEAYVSFSALLELVNLSLEGDDHLQLYQYFDRAVGFLATTPLFGLLSFCIDMHHLHGISLVMHHCIICESKKNITGIHLDRGGLVCVDCLTKHGGQKLNKQVLIDFIGLHHNPKLLVQASPSYPSLLRIVIAHLEERLSLTLTTARRVIELL